MYLLQLKNSHAPWAGNLTCDHLTLRTKCCMYRHGEGNGTYFSILIVENPMDRGVKRLHSMGCKIVRHDLVTKLQQCTV